MARGVWLKWALAAVVLAAAGLSAFSDEFAKLAWQRYQNPTPALILSHRNAELAMAIGNFYFGSGSYDLARAKRAYEKAVRIDPKIFWGHYQLARVYQMQGRSRDALQEIDRELEANPENLRTLYVRGLIYGFRNDPGDLERAEDDFRRFTAWAPKEWAGYNDLAWILSKRGKYREAADVIAAAFREVPDGRENPWLWNSLGVAQLNLGEHASAAASFGRAQTLADALTPADWREAYPGNNPADAGGGLAAFRAAIRENLARAKSARVDRARF